MNSYLLLLFLHVLGAVGLFAAWGIEAATLRRLRQAVTVAEARTNFHLLNKQGPMAPVAMLTVLGTGIWMMAVQWGPQPWMTVALVALVVLVVVGVVLARRARPRLSAALAGELERLPANFPATTGSLAVSLQLRVALGVGILGLMTVKPGALGALAIMSTAIVVGLGLAFHTMRRRTPAIMREVTSS